MMTSEHTYPAIAEEFRLLDDFAPVTPEEWRAAALKLLKGKSFEETLLTATYEGITLQPLYTQADLAGLPTDSLPGFPPFLRGSRATGHKIVSWDVAQAIPAALPAEFNPALRRALENDQTAVVLTLDQAAQQGCDPDQAPAEEIGCGGLSVATIRDLEQALAGIELERLPLFAHSGAAALPLAALLLAWLQRSGQSAAALRGCLGYDPLGFAVRTGALPYSLNTAYGLMADLTCLHRQAPGLRTILVQGAVYHDAGGNAVQELACVMATAVAYLREMLERGLAPAEVLPRVQFDFAVGTTYFLEIAKLRAARLLWAKIVHAFGGDAAAQPVHLHARTALRNKTVRDPYNNMLRATVEAFAAVLGGCDSLQIGCFDQVVRRPDDFSRRIARNVHAILKEEAHLHEVIDPAGGAWYVETLTDALARQAWALFQEIERDGGMAEALAGGGPQRQVAAIAAQRRTRLEAQQDVLVGATKYVNPDETPLTAEQPEANDAWRQQRAAAVSNYRAQRGPVPEVAGRDLASLTEAAAAGATLGELAQLVREPEAAYQVTPLLRALPV